MTDDIAAYLHRVRAQLAENFTVEEGPFGDRPLLVGRRSDFRLRWFAARLKTTIVVAEFGPDVTTAELDEFLSATNREARAAHGAVPRGLQTGVAGISVAVLPTMTAIAREWANTSHGHQFAALAYPVAVGVDDKIVVQPKRLVVGRLFAGFMRDVVASGIAAPL